MGPPTLPSPVVPSSVKDLTGVAKDGNVHLEWTIPTTDTKGRELKRLRTFEIYRREVPSFPPWEFSEDPEGWRPKGSLAPFKVHEGILRTVLQEGDVAFMVSNEGKPLIDASTIKYIKIRLRARNSLEGYFLFITESDKAWDMDLSKEYIPTVYTSYASYASDLAPLKRKKFLIANDTYFHEYTLDMSTVPSWAGSITQVGLLLTYSREPEVMEVFTGAPRHRNTETPRREGEETVPASPRPRVPGSLNGGHEIEIDYIRISQQKDLMATQYERFPWLFIEDEEGWSVQPVEDLPCCKPITVTLPLAPSPTRPFPLFGAAQGFLYAESQNAPLFLTSRSGIDLDPTQFNQIEIRMKVSQGREGYLLFQTEAKPLWDLNLEDQYIPTVHTSYNRYLSTLDPTQRIQFSIPGQDTFVTYRFNMYTLPSWTNKIKRIGLFFPTLEGERRVLIDSIQVLYKDPKSIEQDGEIQDGHKVETSLELTPTATQGDPQSPGPGIWDNNEKLGQGNDTEKLAPARQIRIVSHPKVLTELSPPSTNGQDPTDYEIRQVVLAEAPVPQASFVPYEALPASKERSFDPIKLAVIHLDNPEPARIEKVDNSGLIDTENLRITFTDNGRLVNVDPKEFIKGTVEDPGAELPPEIPLKPWAKYEYYIISTLDKRRQSDKSNTITVRASKDPAPPSYVEARAGDGKVHIQWHPTFLTTDGFKLRSLAGYNVYRATKRGEYPDKPVNPKILTDTQFTDAPLENGQTYYYAVRTVGETVPHPQESANSKEVKATPVDLIPPASPSGLKGTFLEDSVRLYWDPNHEKDFIGYNIYRSDQKEGGYMLLNEEPIPQASYRDFNIEQNKIYYYKVTALDDESPPNESKESTIVEINTSPEE